jgi:2-methylcitrate dehydratase PrpD
MEILNEITSFIEETRFEHFPPEVVNKAKEGVIDFLGCTLLGTKNDVGKMILNHVKHFEAKPEAAALGAGFKTSVPLAALATGVCSHADDFDDISWSLPGHPSVTVLPVVMSIGELLNISGKDLLTAYLIGFEIECKLGLALAPKLYQNGWHATSVYGCLGAAAAAAKLLKLSREQIRNCMGTAASLASGLRANLGTMTKPLHVGNCCQNGVTAALLAKEGLTASSEALDGDLGFCKAFAGGVNHDKIIGKLGNPYDIIDPGILFKLYPSCAETHTALDAAISLAQKHNIQPDDVLSVPCIVTPLNYDVLIYSSPQTALEGKFSLNFCVAVGILKRKASLEEFQDEMVSNPAIIQLMRKVTMRSDPSLAEDGYTGATNIVNINTKDGKEYSLRVDHAKGSPEYPLSLDELLEKYRACAGAVLSPEALDRSIHCLLELEKLDRIDALILLLNEF